MRPFYEPVMPAVTIWTLMCYVLRMITFIYGKTYLLLLLLHLILGLHLQYRLVVPTITGTYMCGT